MEFADFSAFFNSILADNDLSEYADERVARAFFQLTEYLLETNEKMNLTAIREPRAVVLKHFADSLTAAAFLPQNAHVLDVGCGAGFPTLPLAVCRPDLRLTALDSTEKKVRFVADAARRLGVRAETAAARAEELAHTARRERFDACVARAVAALPVLAELCLPFVRVGGVFLAMKSARAEEEIGSARRAVALLGGKIRAVHAFSLKDAVLGIEEPRTIVEIEKIAPTPAAYPRAYAKIVRAPL